MVSKEGDGTVLFGEATPPPPLTSRGAVLTLSLALLLLGVPGMILHSGSGSFKLILDTQFESPPARDSALAACAAATAPVINGSLVRMGGGGITAAGLESLVVVLGEDKDEDRPLE